MQASDLLSVRLLHASIVAGTCLWHGASAGPCWRLLATMAACTAADWAASIVLILFTSALLVDRRAGVHRLHVALHCVCLAAEAGIALATCLLLFETDARTFGSGGLAGSYEATMAFFGALQHRIALALCALHAACTACASNNVSATLRPRALC